MELNTASEVINFAARLEDESKKFYESLAERYKQNRELSLLFAREGDKNKTAIKRAYYEVASDALEMGFSFEGLDTDKYLVGTQMADIKDYAAAIRKAIKLEENAQNFYLAVADKSRSLMADLPRLFELVARKRGKREQVLRSLLGKVLKR